MVESCDHGFIEDSDDSSVEDSAGGSLKHLLIVLLLPAVQVNWGMLVTSSKLAHSAIECAAGQVKAHLFVVALIL